MHSRPSQSEVARSCCGQELTRVAGDSRTGGVRNHALTMACVRLGSSRITPEGLTVGLLVVLPNEPQGVTVRSMLNASE